MVNISVKYSLKYSLSIGAHLGYYGSDSLIIDQSSTADNTSEVMYYGEI